jgi:hypothetical protein
MTNKYLGILLIGLLVSLLGNVTLTSGPVASGMPLGDLGKQMVEAGVVDREKFLALYARSPELRRQAEELLDGKNVRFEITAENSGLILNYLWALGLSNKNPILEMEMMDPRYGGAQNFASTGGWTLAKGDTMEHYDMHQFITLSDEEQALVDKVSRTIFRPCCSNSAHFPDCNHGMAMLGYLELLAASSVGEKEMTERAHLLNSYWFPNYKSSSCGV